MRVTRELREIAFFRDYAVDQHITVPFHRYSANSRITHAVKAEDRLYIWWLLLTGKFWYAVKHEARMMCRYRKIPIYWARETIVNRVLKWATHDDDIDMVKHVLHRTWHVPPMVVITYVIGHDDGAALRVLRKRVREEHIYRSDRSCEWPGCDDCFNNDWDMPPDHLPPVCGSTMPSASQPVEEQLIALRPPRRGFQLIRNPNAEEQLIALLATIPRCGV